MTSPQSTPYPLRMPEELRERLADRAKANGRSLNAEIVAILQHAVDSPSGAPDLDAFADQLAEKLAVRLKGK
jgi:plasmid stability protein